MYESRGKDTTREFEYKISSADNSSIILVVPFYNESANIPAFASCFTKNSNLKNLYLLGIDHQSTDNSAKSLLDSTLDVGALGLALETSTIAAGGIPRARGFELAVGMATEQRLKGKKVVVGSIDIDTSVSPDFISEVDRFRTGDKDFLIFPTRYDQQLFLKCVELQDETAKPASIRSLIGIDWLKFQLRGFLLEAGAIETRGSGGYFLTLDGYKKAQGHHQVFSRDSKVVTGENNAMGIRAKRNGATMEVSTTVQRANPRRMLNSISENLEEYQESNSGRSFVRTESVIKLPTVTKDLWDIYFNKSLHGAFRTFVAKALAYDVTEKVKEYFPKDSNIPEFLDMCLSFCQQTEFTGDERDAIGSVQYLDIFAKTVNFIGKEKFKDILNLLKSGIPQNQSLLSWAKLDNKNLKIAEIVGRT